MAVSVAVWGVTVWLLQKVWHHALGGLNLSLSSSIFYGLGLMLEEPPEEPPSNLTGQVSGWRDNDTFPSLLRYIIIIIIIITILITN